MGVLQTTQHCCRMRCRCRCSCDDVGCAGISTVAARTEAMVSQELGVQIEEPFSILPLESIFDALQAAARARDSHRPTGSPAATTTIHGDVLLRPRRQQTQQRRRCCYRCCRVMGLRRVLDRAQAGPQEDRECTLICSAASAEFGPPCAIPLAVLAFSPLLTHLISAPFFPAPPQAWSRTPTLSGFRKRQSVPNQTETKRAGNVLE